MMIAASLLSALSSFPYSPNYAFHIVGLGEINEMAQTYAAQKNPAEIPQHAEPKSMNQVVWVVLLVYNPAPYKGYPMAYSQFCDLYS